MSKWEMILYAVAAYTAVMTLVRFMRQRRNALTAQLRKAFDEEHERAAEAMKKQKRREEEAKRQTAFEQLLEKTRDAA
ncbi:hypothetical protein LOC68_18015 [Blastopirellula sp. JC732]|uniref:Uncharacterized protein n=1 Tax=Blastopirellula sediminis TaxID=2894196 RepID=A0A9X1SGK7_9BACT|nr:hypothetical protein [Blastopirellula sediminis]MCC9606407.1 hypothetical protein [Blastopirellula sediminis]MCC9630295.1 hypothetical protein [Blastopirellula sediminis]